MFNEKIFNEIIEKCYNQIGLDKVVINTTNLYNKKILNQTLKIREEYRDVDIIVKEIVREDFLGGVLSTLQLFDRGNFILLDMDCKLILPDLDDLTRHEVSVGVSKKTKCNYIYSFELDDENNVVNVYTGLKADALFSGILKFGDKFINNLKRLLLLYYNPEYIKFENMVTSYIKLGGNIKAVYVD